MYEFIHMCKVKNLTDTENRLVVVRGRAWRVEEMGEGSQKAKRRKKHRFKLFF